MSKTEEQREAEIERRLDEWRATHDNELIDGVMEQMREQFADTLQERALVVVLARIENETLAMWERITAEVDAQELTQ